MADDVEGKSLNEAARFWKSFNLRRQSNEIDSQILKIYDKEQHSTESRKKLARITKELGSLKPADKLKAIKSVIRAYQKEIDQLTQRATFSENALIAIYKGLCDAPDPAKYLETAIGNAKKLKKFEKEMTSIQSKLQRYEDEFKGLKNQEVTVQTLKEQNQQFLRKMEELKESAKAREQNLVAKESKELKTKLDQQEQEYMARLEAAQTALTRLTMSQQQLQSRLYDATSKTDALEEEAANTLVTSLRGENSNLKAELKALRDGGGQDSGFSDGEDEIDDKEGGGDVNNVGVRRSRREKATLASSSTSSSSSSFSSELQRRLRQAELNAREERKRHAEQITALKADLSKSADALEAKEGELQDTRVKMAELPSKESYRRLKRRVVLLQEMGFNVIDPDIDGKGGGDSINDAAMQLGSGLSDSEMSDRTAEELLILQEARRLKTEITKNKVGWSECKEQLAVATEELEERNRLVSEQKALLVKLEEDLEAALKTKKHLNKDSDSSSPKPRLKQIASNAAPAERQLDRDAAILSSALKGGGDQAASSSSSTSGDGGGGGQAASIGASGGAGGDDQSMLLIVSGQRDRFRQRIQQLEREQITAHNMRKVRELTEYPQNKEIFSCTANIIPSSYILKHTLCLFFEPTYQELQQQIRKLRGENITLYEKLQYVSSYRSSSSSSTKKQQKGDGEKDTELGMMGEGKEENPYQLFRRRQRQAHYDNLSTQEKIIHKFWEFLFSKHSHRFLLFGYALFLHFLVFVTLWRHTHIPPCPPQ
eukprot:jgi/Bigna1/73975/fgenesh1_pg.27_\